MQMRMATHTISRKIYKIENFVMLGRTPVFRPKSCVYTKSNRSLHAELQEVVVTVISGNLNKVYVAYQYRRQSFFVPSTQLLPKNNQNIKQAKQNICQDMTFEPCETARTHCIRCCVLSNKKHTMVWI